MTRPRTERPRAAAESVAGCPLPDGTGGPSCATGPAGRLSWTVRELVSILGHRDPAARDDQEADLAS